MATAVQQQRLQLRFQLWDKDGDGKVGVGDFEAEAKRIVDAVGVAANSPKATALVNNYTAMFDPSKFAGPVGGVLGGLTSTAKSAVSLTPDVFVATFDTLISSGGDAGLGSILDPCIASIAAALDTDGDGQVKLPEFKLWLGAIGSDQKADEAFAKIDSDGDGQVSVQQIVDAVRNYHLGKFDAPLLG